MRLSIGPHIRAFSATSSKSEIRHTHNLPDRTRPSFHGMLFTPDSWGEDALILAETTNNDLLSLQWPSPPRNILLVKKDHSPPATAALLEFAK